MRPDFSLTGISHFAALRARVEVYAAGMKYVILLATSILTAGAGEARTQDALPAGFVTRLGGRLMAHPGRVWTVAFSSDGKLLFTVDDDDEWIWEAASGKLF